LNETLIFLYNFDYFFNFLWMDIISTRNN